MCSQDFFIYLLPAQREKSQGFGDSVPKKPGSARDIVIAACAFITDTNLK